MSKFMNYVKKFLTLSFMSTVAAFGLSFNNVSATDQSVIDKNISATSVLRTVQTTDQENKSKESEETPGNIYEYDDEKKTAIWTGNTNEDVTDVYVPERTDNYDVVGAVFGKTKSNIKSITLNTSKYNSAIEGPNPMPNIVIEDVRNWPMLQKIRIDFDKNIVPREVVEESAAAASDFGNALKSFLIGSTGLALNSSELTKLLEKNSDNVQSSWYYCEDNDKGIASFIGEINLLSADKWGNIDQDGVECTLENGGYTLTSIPNREKVIIPAAEVGPGGMLLKLRSVNLPNSIQTDKIKQIKITNIQDEDQLDSILKYAKNWLSNFGNGINDETDWETDGDFAENRSLIFNRIYRDGGKILADMLTEFMEQEKLYENMSISDEERYQQFKDIFEKNYDKLSKDDQDGLSFFFKFLNSLKNNKIEENTEDYLKGTIDSESSSSGVSSSSSDGSNTRVGTINRVLNALSDVIDLFDKDEFSKMTDDERKEEYEKILDANFSGGSEQTQRARTLLGKFIDRLYKSEFLSSLRSVSKFYGVLKDIYGYIKQSEGQSVSDEEILSNTIEVLNKRYDEDSDEKEILENLTKWFVESGKLRQIINDAKGLKNNSNVLNSTSDSAQTSNDLSRPENANSLSASSSSNSDNSSNSDSVQATTDLSRPEDANSLSTSSSSSSSNESTSNSSASNSLSSSSSESAGTNNTVSATTTESSKLYEAVTAWTKWMENEGKNVSGEKQYAYLETLIDNVKDKLTEEEKASAAEILNRAYTELVEKSKQSTTTTGSSTSSGTSSTSATKTSSSSASTKTSDSSVSPELLSLMLSGSLAGLGISLKKRHE